MIRFLLVFLLLASIISLEPVIAHVREPYCELLARSLAFVFSLTGLRPVLMGSTILVGFGQGLTVVPECDGLVLLFLFIAGVAAMPIQRTLRPYVFAGGFLALLVVINWLRLAVLALTGFYQSQLFDVVHVYVIQGLLILAVIILFVAWLSVISPEPTGMEASKT